MSCALGDTDSRMESGLQRRLLTTKPHNAFPIMVLHPGIGCNQAQRVTGCRTQKELCAMCGEKATCRVGRGTPKAELGSGDPTPPSPCCCCLPPPPQHQPPARGTSSALQAQLSLEPASQRVEHPFWNQPLPSQPHWELWPTCPR